MKKVFGAAAICGLMLTACSTTVPGSGAIDPNANGASSTDSSSNGGEQRQSLSWGGGTVISPDNAPYCYLLPRGLRQIDQITFPGQGRYTSAVGIDDNSNTTAPR